MKTSKFVLSICAAFVVASALASISQAQNREKFGISAKAGGVNAVSGRVMVKRDGQEPQLLSGHDDLASGDVVTTSFGSQAEILLNPGSYLRLAENSEFVLVDNSLDNLMIKLNKGSAIVEATGGERIALRIPVITDRQRLTIVRSGIYRFNVKAGVTELLVRKGRVMIGDDPLNIAKAGSKLTFTGRASETAKLAKNDKDEFDNWSKERAEALARANQKLSARALNGYLSSNIFNWPSRIGRWGVWTWSPFASCYTFLPFYYGWSSPYGRYYGLYAGFDGFYPGGGCCRPHIYNQPVIAGNPSSGGSTGSYPGSSGASGNGSSGSGSSGTFGGTSTPSSPPSQAGPRDPDSGSRAINRIKDPN